MNLTRDRLQSISWAFTLTVCAVLMLALTFKVNAVKSDVRLTERQLSSLRQEKLFLETEFQTRANQQQMKALNDVEFGFKAPTTGQYIEGERQLAALGVPRAPQAPEPILMAKAEVAVDESVGTLAAMVSPLTGRALAAEPSTRILHAPTVQEAQFKAVMKRATQTSVPTPAKRPATASDDKPENPELAPALAAKPDSGKQRGVAEQTHTKPAVASPPKIAINERGHRGQAAKATPE